MSKKISELANPTTPFNKGSIVAMSEFDGVSTYTPTSKVTMSELGDSIFAMDAEQLITFDSSGTNKKLAQNSTTNGNYVELNSTHLGLYCAAGSYVEMQGGGVTNYTAGWFYADDNTASFGNNDGEFRVNTTESAISYDGNDRVVVNATGIGFFGATPVAQPTGVAVTAGGIHAALVSLGLITA